MYSFIERKYSLDLCTKEVTVNKVNEDIKIKHD